MKKSQSFRCSPKKCFRLLDHLICIKNGYLFWKHLVPFTIASLLLLLLTIPKDNLLLNLSHVLQKPDVRWIPAILLTLISLGVYVTTVYVNVRKLYLCSRYDISRTLGTCLAYLIICTLMAYPVLLSALTRDVTLGDLWSCLLLTAFSLTGIGWSGPNSWVEAVGISSPNYEDGRRLINEFEELLKELKEKPFAANNDVDKFVDILEGLQENIESNLYLEPAWFKHDMKRVTRLLRRLIDATKNSFPPGSSANLAPACRNELKLQYTKFFNLLTKLQSAIR